MFSFGIVDPKKVTRCALQNATSVASVFLTTQVAISDVKSDKVDASDLPMPPMGMGM